MKNAIRFLILSLILYGCRHTEKDHYESVVYARDSTKWKLLQDTANDYYKNDEYTKSIEYFSKLIVHDSTQGEFYFKRGYSYAMLINKSKAIDDFKKSLLYNFKNASSCYNIGVNYSYVDDTLALRYFKKCKEIDPTYQNVDLDISDCIHRISQRRPKSILPSKTKQ